MHYFFCGVGGSGMSPLARLMRAKGDDVSGSDRSNDARRNKPLFEALQTEGIKLFPQDGSGVLSTIDQFVATRAIEPDNPDLARASELGISIIKREKFITSMFADTRNVCIAGTSGKSTTTGMVGYILEQHGNDPTVVNGATLVNWGTNFRRGEGNLVVFEADESDGSTSVAANCHPAVAVLTNIAFDHFAVDELERIFRTFVESATVGVVINADCVISRKLLRAGRTVLSFGLRDADITPQATNLELTMLGDHNVANGLAAIAACQLLGLSISRSAEILESFRGLRRRLEIVATGNGVTVVDDFASNGSKITATLRTLRSRSDRLIVVFQPHGFGPAKQLRDDYIKTFGEELREQDILVMANIYYAGGDFNYVDGKRIGLPTDVSSEEIAEGVRQKHPLAHFVADRSQILLFLEERAKPGDTIIVMGSRDETLPDFARQIAERVSGQ